MGRKGQFFKNLIILSFGTILPKATFFIILPILTGKLSTMEYGTYDLIVSIATLLLPVSTLQIQTAAFRYLIDHREDNYSDRIITNTILFVLPVSIIVLFAFYFFAVFLSPILRIFSCFYFLFDIIVRVLQQIARGIGNNKVYSISAILESFINLFLIVSINILTEINLQYIIICGLTAYLLTILYMSIKLNIFSKIRIQYFSKDVLSELLKYSWPMIPNTLSLWVLRLSDRMVISLNLGIEANAVYAAATNIPVMLNVLQNAYTLAWQENASITKKDKDVDDYYTNMYDMSFSFLSGATALLIAMTPILFRLLIKENYAESYPQIPILFIGTLGSCISAFLGGIYVANKRTKSVGMTTLIAAGLNLLIDIVFINYIGIYAASISTLVSYIFIVVYRMVDIQKFQSIKYNIKKVGACILVLALMCILCAKQNTVYNIINCIVGVAFFAYINKQYIKESIDMVNRKLG